MKLTIWIMVVATACPVWAEAGHYRISTEQVAATVSRMGMQVAPEQVTLLADVVATTAAPRLKVRSITPWGSQRMMARLECENSNQCLPFVVGLRVNQDGAAQAEAEPQALPATPSPAGPKNFVVRNGSVVTLLLDGGRVHIRLSVICLENGVTGQTIRATTKDRRIVYRAQVVDGGQLQGSL